MALRIITADERMAEPRGVKACVFGKSGIGKTSLLWSLPEDGTLFIDLEAGDLAVQGWPGASVRPRTWEECRDLALVLAGPNPALRDDQAYSTAQHARVARDYGDPSQMDRYRTLFIDSITVAGRLCFQWCRGQPEAFSERTSKPDIRGAYGLHGREMLGWLTHLQHARGRNVVFVGILDERLDDFNRRVFAPQIDGSKTGLELPGIVDQVITMAEIKPDQVAGQPAVPPYRALVCQTINPWGFPAKDRSGRLDLVEPPDLGRLFEKIAGPARPIAERLALTAPATALATPSDTPAA
ncbi:ATP-binding protein [Roseomonas sp. NAR14]|uniref:ATP-binding protein n=1 Tax=Roseomonas acroporae TaxID=2937791 RepID=A0A9X2BW12_9PROT|nr:ATP-binding protein [Roseomonas acroporae]MCK8787242.1 ATP-binding protein [Roseomonas acroporae]